MILTNKKSKIITGVSLFQNIIIALLPLRKSFFNLIRKIRIQNKEHADEEGEKIIASGMFVTKEIKRLTISHPTREDDNLMHLT